MDLIQTSHARSFMGLLRLEPSVASQEAGDGGDSEQAQAPALVVNSRASSARRIVTRRGRDVFRLGARPRA